MIGLRVFIEGYSFNLFMDIPYKFEGLGNSSITLTWESFYANRWTHTNWWSDTRYIDGCVNLTDKTGRAAFREKFINGLRAVLRDNNIVLSSSKTKKIEQYTWQSVLGLIETVAPFKPPKRASVLWEDWKKRNHNQKVYVVDFISEVYGNFLKEGVMTLKDLRRLDPGAHRALYNWSRTHGVPARNIVPKFHKDADAIVKRLGREPTHKESIGRLAEEASEEVVALARARRTLYQRKSVARKRILSQGE